jgi:hypothetical protein
LQNSPAAAGAGNEKDIGKVAALSRARELKFNRHI